MATTTIEGFRRSQPATRQRSHEQQSGGESSCSQCNVATTERVVSLTAGAILAGIGLKRRDLTGAVVAAVGGALAYRGATGHCHMYDALGINTASSSGVESLEHRGVKVTEHFTIDRPQEELYSFWRGFERLPEIMSHLESVRVIDEKRSEWVAKGPAIVGGEVRWEAEITDDQPNERIAWQTLPGSSVEHRGSISFKPAIGDRGTSVRVDLEYAPPAGQVGRWIAKLFGEEPEQQVRSDLRKFKRLMETGEIPTIEGQPRGSCYGLAGLLRK